MSSGTGRLEYENLTMDQIRPPYAFLYGLLILGSIFFVIFKRLDTSRLYFSGCLVLAGLLSAYYLRYARRSKASLQGVSIVFFVVVWLGIHSFSNQSNIIDLAPLSLNFTLQQGQIHYLAILPLILVWMVPHNPDTFFGLSEVTKEIAIKAQWKSSILLIVLIKFFSFLFNLPVILEFIILIPLISEHIKLYNNSKDKPPILTLHFQQELIDRFSVPISLLKAVGLIMVLFLFSVLQSRLWLLVILGYFIAGLIWSIDAIIPEEARSSSKEKTETEMAMEQKIEEKITSFFESKAGKQPPKEKTPTSKRQHKESTVVKAKTSVTVEEQPSDTSLAIEESQVIEVEGEITDLVARSSGELVDPEVSSISEKAFHFGRKVRTEVQKPLYTLNHILGTLTEEDFSTAYRVEQEGLLFDSLNGHWTPPVGLILIPIELGKYDYRREGEILLLGFNQPKEDKEKTKDKDKSDKDFGMKISDNAIRFGDTVFNMKTLVVSNTDWEEIKSKLSKVDPDEDISYTGFASLNELQEKLGIISEKWVEIRQQAKEVTVNFVAGLLGASEPVFVGTDQIEKLETGTRGYLVEPADDE